MKFVRLCSNIKEPFCGLSHAVGAILSVVVLIVLLVMAGGRLWHTIGFAVYGVSLIALYTASTLFHSLSLSPRGDLWLRRFDYCAIYALIAGSYTPLCLVTLRGTLGWTLLAVVWTLALVGIAATLFWKSKPDWLRVMLYVMMGWMVMLAWEPLRAALPAGGLAWLTGGGIVYSIGTIIFALDRPHLWPGKFSAHDLWHLFVLGGSGCHFMVMLRYVAPVA